VWYLRCAGLLALTAGCGGISDAASAGGTPPVPVEVVTVKAIPLRETTEYVSTLKSRRSVSVQPQVNGWVTAIDVDAGARVKPGTTLMRIDARRQIANLRGQEAARQARQADLEYWKQQYRRQQLLYRGGGASRQELDQARSSLTSAQAAVSGQDQQVRAAEVELRFFRVIAPEAGTVGDIPVRVGDLVTPQTQLTTIDHNEELEAYIGIPVEQAGRVRLGMPVEILVGKGTPPLSSQATFIAPQVSGEQTVLVKSLVDNQSGRLRNAQLVRARMIWGERQGPAVPVLAVQTLNGQTFVWTVKDAPGQGLLAEQRTIQVGPMEDQHYPVLRGLAPGDRVIVAGMQKLRPGAPVTPAKPGPAGGRGDR
jgi:RND family efflux transporter MFP subunit